LFFKGFAQVIAFLFATMQNLIRNAKTRIANEAITMTELTGKVGFASPIAHRSFASRRRGIELFATVALAVSLVVAATAVSIGMARAQAPIYSLALR
jgi:hypothetical protein